MCGAGRGELRFLGYQSKGAMSVAGGNVGTALDLRAGGGGGGYAGRSPLGEKVMDV